jgi:hypothetical protein
VDTLPMWTDVVVIPVWSPYALAGIADPWPPPAAVVVDDEVVEAHAMAPTPTNATIPSAPIRAFINSAHNTPCNSALQSGRRYWSRKGQADRCFSMAAKDSHSCLAPAQVRRMHGYEQLFFLLVHLWQTVSRSAGAVLRPVPMCAGCPWPTASSPAATSGCR